MKAVVQSPRGAVSCQDVPSPPCPEDGFILRVEAALVEDEGLLGPPHGLIPGFQCAGTVVEVGEKATRFKVGDRAVSLLSGGAQAEFAAASERQAWPIPPSMSFTDACVVPAAWGAANDSLFEFGSLRCGDIVLVDLASDDFGLAAVQQAVHAGAQVIATAADRKSIELLLGLGAYAAIDYRKVDVQTECYRLTRGRGVNLGIFRRENMDLERLLATVAYRGVALTVGGPEHLEGVCIPKLSQHNKRLQGLTFGPTIFHERDRVADLVAGLLQEVAQGTFKIEISEVLPFSEASDAYARHAERKSAGAFLLTP